MAINTTPKLIALSVGGSERDLAEYGLGPEHLNELMVRLSRRLLQDGHRLAYGGTLRGPRDELTNLLIDAAQSWLAEQLAKNTDIRDATTWPLVNYVAGPYHSLISSEFEAQLVGVCKFVKVVTSDVTIEELTQMYNENPDSVLVRRHIANSLTLMRDTSSKECDLRIIWGGTIRGAEGWKAGIAEEVLFTIRHKKPMLIFGGFGGCARVLTDFLKDSSAPWPEALTFSDACLITKYNELIKDDNHRSDLGYRYDELRQHITRLRDKIHEKATTDIYGIPANLFRTALHVTSVSQAIKLAREVVQILA